MLCKTTRLLGAFALVVLALSLVTPAFGQAVNDVYQVAYFSQQGPGVAVRIINTGQVGSPIDAATKQGKVCADIYVFDANQEMLACCSCPITANGLSELRQVNTLTQVNPPNGVVKIVSDQGCDETALSQLVPGALRAFATNPQLGGLTETLFQQAPLTSTEQTFLGNACSFVHYLGSGRGTCGCAAGDSMTP